MSDIDNNGWDISKGDYLTSTKIPGAQVGGKQFGASQFIKAAIAAVFMALGSYFILTFLEFI